jgi:hypothetical protein
MNCGKRKVCKMWGLRRSNGRPVLSEIACSIKGDVKEHFSPCTGGADFFRDIQRLSPRRTLVGVVPLGLVCSISAGSSSWVATTLAVSETGQALWLYGVNHGSI